MMQLLLALDQPVLQQAKSFGCEIKGNVAVMNVDLSGDLKMVTLSDGTFIFIGYLPNTEFLKDKVDLNKWGEIIVKNDMSKNIVGVYVTGESIAKRYRQVTTAVSDGTIAALAASGYLNEMKVKHNQLITA